MSTVADLTPTGAVLDVPIEHAQDAAFDHVVFVNWTPEGQMGELLSIIARYSPPPPAFASPPPLWGSEEHVRDLFGEAVELTFTRGLAPWRFESPDAYVTFMETHYGPLVRLRERLYENRWRACRDEILAMVERRNEASDGSLRLYAEYLVVVAHKPQ
jgi:hypothetical protein